MADFTYVTPVKFWSQKVLPLVYDDSLSYMELLNKVIFKLNEVINNTNEIPDYISEKIREYITTGEIVEIVREILPNIVSLSNFGAVGDGVTDDTAAIKECLNYAANNNKTVMGNFGEYVISDTLNIDGTKIKTCHIEGTIKPAFNNKPAVVITDAGNADNAGGNYEFHVVGNEANGGYNFDGVTDFNIGDLPFKGVSVVNCYHSTFKLTVRNCHIGVRVQANTSGTAYNTFYITDVGDNAVSIDLLAKDYGFVNENLFVGTSVQDYSSNPNKSKVIGIRLWTDNSPYFLNANTFDKVTLQCGGAPVVLSNARDNEFTSVRCESSGRPASLDFYVMCKNICKRNRFSPLYEPETSAIYDTFLGAANNFSLGNFMTGTCTKLPALTWVYNKTKLVQIKQSLIVEGLDNYCLYNQVTQGQPEYAYGAFSDDGITPTTHNYVGRYFDISVSPIVMGLANAVSGDCRWGIILFDENFSPVEISRDSISDTNYSDNYYSSMTIETINGVKFAHDGDNANNLLRIFGIKQSNAKYAFVGVTGATFNKISFYSIVDTAANRIINNMLPKRMVEPDGITLPNASELKVANVGQFVRNNSGTIIEDSNGNYIITGYIRTGGTVDAPTFATVKSLVV